MSVNLDVDKEGVYHPRFIRWENGRIDMRMIGPALANLVCEAKIPWMKQMQPFDDRIMVKAAVFWIVDGQRPSAALWVLCSHVMVSFLCYRYLAAPR